jgi:hypothetical protein
MLSGRKTIDEDRVQVAHYALFSARAPKVCQSIFVFWKPEMESHNVFLALSGRISCRAPANGK